MPQDFLASHQHSVPAISLQVLREPASSGGPVSGRMPPGHATCWQLDAWKLGPSHLRRVVDVLSDKEARGRIMAVTICAFERAVPTRLKDEFVQIFRTSSAQLSALRHKKQQVLSNPVSP